MLDLPPGPAFVDALKAVWEAGDAAFPLDGRLPSSAASEIVELVGPAAVITADGERRGLADGRAVEPGDALVVATSGTTGTPKAVIHTHESILASAQATSAALDVDPATDRWLACLPPAHIGGLAVITRALVTGTGLIVHPSFDPTATMQAAAQGATLVSLVTRALGRVDPAGFRAILLGGAAPPADRPANAIATYGMTETGSGCVYDGYPLDGVELTATDRGEIMVRSAALLRAYRTSDRDHDPKIDGWFATGDLGRIETDGRLWIDGRAGDMIITGGENVWPHRAEARLEAHPAIDQAAVFGLADEEWGQRVVAAVVTAPEAGPLGLNELRDWIRAELPVWYAPTQLTVVDRLPRTALGKIKRAALAATVGP